MNVFDILREKFREDINDNPDASLGEYRAGMWNAIEIVNQVENEYNKKYEPTIDLIEFGVDGYNHHLKEQYRKGYKDGLNADKWIPCTRELPTQPKSNPEFEGKPLELYLVSMNYSKYPWRAFWNGKYFTDGFSKVYPVAWQPLPPKNEPKGE